MGINRLELYTDKDMVSFGEYLLSKERRDILKSHPEFEDDRFMERYSQVSHADFENWRIKYNKEKIS